MEKKRSCIDIASLKMSKNVYSRLVYCKISDDIVVDSECLLLLPRAGRGFTVRHYKSLSDFFYLAIF